MLAGASDLYLLKRPAEFQTTFFQIRYASYRGLLLISRLTSGFQLYVANLTNVERHTDVSHSCQTWFGVGVVLGMVSIATSNCELRSTMSYLSHSNANSPRPPSSMGPLGSQDPPCGFHFDSFCGDTGNVDRLYGLRCFDHDT